MTTRKDLKMLGAGDMAICFKDVSKIYRLHGSQKDQLIEALQLNRFGLRPRTQAKEFSALAHIDWGVTRGRRVGIVGRNGSGKTTLLKLICGNFAPTSGVVKVAGRVQALMNVGIGFHPEFTGRENIEASLHYNGLDRSEYDAAVQGIIEFCELGEFIDQPFKTYSLGMQARLMFAAATAIQPEILIIDEVLGAGDAYFIAKSKKRIDKLISNGCTMLLVSHSMNQILELCDRAIWLDQGKIRMDDSAFLVVKRYEEYLQRTVESLDSRPNLTTSTSNAVEHASHTKSEVAPAIDPVVGQPHREVLQVPAERMQIPFFMPHAALPRFPPPAPALRYLAPGGLSRWVEDPPVKIIGLDLQTEVGSTNRFVCFQPARFVIDLKILRAGIYNCCYGLAIHNQAGICVTRLFSSPDSFVGNENGRRQVSIVLNPCQIGPGEYTLGISVTEHVGIERLNEGKRFDLLSRSFLLEVVLPDSLGAVSAAFLHSSEWTYSEAAAQ